MCLGMITTAYAEEPTVKLTVTADKTSAKVGEVVTFTVTCTSTKKLYGLEAKLDIPSAFTYVENSGALADGVVEAIGGTSDSKYIEANKHIWLENTSTPMTITGTVTLATFQCTASASGTSTVNLTGVAGLDEDFNSFTYSVAPANVTVNAELTSVDVAITAPVKSATPQDTITAGTGYTGAIAWEGSPAKFAPNTVYSANVTLTAATGYKFASDATVAVTGSTGITETTVAADGSTLSFKATFPKTADKDPLEGSVSITGTPKIGVELTANTAGITSADPGTLTYKWYRGDALISGATTDKYTPNSAEDVGKTIKVEVSAANYSGSLNYTTTAVAKADGPAAPAAPTATKTANSITITSPDSAYQYACVANDTALTEADWTDNTSFNGLSANTEYDVYARVKATATHNASAASEKADVTTDKAPAGDPVVPEVASKNDTSITVTAVSGQKYCIKLFGEPAPTAGDSSWGDTVSFTGLTPNTKYVIYTYIPESGSTLASTVVYTEATTDKTVITDTLVPVNDLTGKIYNAEAQEPTFGGSLTKDTDYTVSYSVKNAGEGQLQDGKPCGAGTYVVTVAGMGNYGNSFTKYFTIGKKVVTVTPDADQTKTYGDTDPALTYTTGLTGELATAFNAAKTGALARVEGENVGNYAINLGNLAAGDNFDVKLSTTTVNFSITAKNVSATRTAEEQNVVKGVGDFTEPTFGSVTGTLAYSYDSATTYAGVKAKLAALATDDTGIINYTYTASGNYTGTITGSINFTVVDVTFDIQAGAITVTSNPTYGDKWSDIVSYDSSKITAKVGTNVCENPTFTLQNDSEYPNYGSQTYTITFSGTIGGVDYANVTVKSDSVSIGKATVTVTAGTYQVSKTYDGTTAAGTATGELSVSGILSKDTSVTVIPTIGAYSNANVGGQDEVNVSLAISGDTNNNYQLESTTVSVPCEITKATLTVEGTASAAADYGTALKDIPITGLTVKLNGADVDGTWAFSGETILDADNSSDYTATFTPTTGAGNYNTLTKGITPTINKVAYSGAAIATTKNVLTNTAQASVEVDMTSLLTAIKGAAVSAASESSDTYNIISSVSTDGNKVKFDVASIAGKDKSATINVTISSTNYNPITATITVTTVDKAEADVSISGAPTSKTYGDADFTLTASVANAGTGTGTWAWISSDPTVLQVTGSGATATVKVLKVGSATITAKYESDTTMGEQPTAAITVDKANITITAKNKTAYVGDAVPALSESDYTVEGLAEGESLKTAPTIAYTSTPDMTKSGSVVIKVSDAEAPVGGNYEEIAYVNGTLTIITKSSGGSSGGSVSTYAITISSAKNGDVTSSHKSAAKGETVTLTVKPDTGYALETLTATDGSGKAVALTEKNGKYTFTMPTSKVTVKATFAEVVAEPENPFVDVPANAYYYDAVLWAAENGITDGTSATTFSPDAGCTRAQIVTFLWRAAGSPAPESSANPFTDVEAGSYYYDAVLWAVEQGITKGTSATAFSPDTVCTRSQTVTFLYRSAGSPAVSGSAAFSDVEAGSYYTDAVVWAGQNSITGGIGGGLFGPANDCSRAQIVTFLYRSMIK